MGKVAPASGGSGASKVNTADEARRAEEARQRAEAARRAVEAARKAEEDARRAAEAAREKKAAAEKVAADALKATQKPGQTPEAARKSKSDAVVAEKNRQQATENAAAAEKKLQEAEEKVVLTAKRAQDAMGKANTLATREKKTPPFTQKDINSVKPKANELASAFEGTSRKAELEKLLGTAAPRKSESARKPEKGEKPPESLDAVDAKDVRETSNLVNGQLYTAPSGTKYQVKTNATTGETVLSDAAGGNTVTIKPDGSYTSTVTAKEPTKSGGTLETTWTKSVDAQGRTTGLESRKSQTEQHPETGATTTTSTTQYDATRSPPVPRSRTEEVRMEKPPAALAQRKGMPQGPATVKTETQFNAQGLPTKQVKTTQVQTPGFNAGAVSAFEAGQDSALRNASKGEDHHKTNNAPTTLKPGESSLTLTEETRFNAKGEPAVSTRKTESVATEALKSDRNGNGVQVVRNQQEVTRGPKDAASTDTLPALTPKTPGTVNNRTTVTGYDPDGSLIGEGHARRSQTVSRSSGTVDGYGRLQLKHEPTEVKGLQEASDNRWMYDHVAFEVGADGKRVQGKEPRQLDKERQLPWYEDMTDAIGDWMGDLADTAGEAVDGVADVVTAPLEEALTDEIKKLNSAGDSLTLSGNLDVKVGPKVGIEGEVGIERTEDGKYQLSAEVTADVGVGLLGSASLGVGGRMEWKFNTPEEAAKAALILGKGPGAFMPGSEDNKFLMDHLSAVEATVKGEVEAGVGGKAGTGGAELSASLEAAGSLRLEFDKGKPTHLVKTVEFSGSGAAGVATGLKDKAGLNVGGDVSGSVSIETKTPLDASKLDGKDVLSLLTGGKSGAAAGPSETSITVEGSVDAGEHGQFFTAEVSGLSDEEVKAVTDKLKGGKFESAFEDLKKEAKVTKGTFKDREAGLGAKLVVVDFEVNARHRDVTAEGGNGNGSTTVSLGSGKRRGGSDGASGSNGSKGGANGSTGPNGSTGNTPTGGADKPARKPGDTKTGEADKPARKLGDTSTNGNGQPGSRTGGPEQAAKPSGNATTNQPLPTEYRVNPATGQLVPVTPQEGGPSRSGRVERPSTPGTTSETRPAPTKEQGDTSAPSGRRRPVPVERNPELPGRTTLVRYNDGKVRIEAGPDATDADIQAHMETARILQRYEGAVGKVRQLIDKVKQAITGMPGYGSQGFESRLEVKKLSNILKSLETTQAQLNASITGVTGNPTPATAEQRADLERQIASVEGQLRTHEAQINSLSSGRGYVAREDELRAPPTSANNRPLDPHVQAAVNTAWMNLTSAEHAKLGAVIESKGFAGLEPAKQEKLIALLGGSNTQMSKPARDKLFKQMDLGYLDPEEQEAEDQTEYLKTYVTLRLPNESNKSTSPDEPEPLQGATGMPKKIQTSGYAQWYDAHRLPYKYKEIKASEQSRGKLQIYEVSIGGDRPLIVTMPPEGTKARQQVPEIEEIAKGLAALPPWARKLVTKVNVDPNPSAVNQASGEQFQIKDFEAFMTANRKGHVTIHQSAPQAEIDGTLVHELAHTLSKRKWLLETKKRADLNKMWAAWDAAAIKDGVAASRYATKAVGEDFCETVALYDQVRGTPQEAEIRALMPERFKLLDAHFPELTEQGR
ncbi:hypothetical protein JQX13_07135 [Archangium violaceum]|uniref:hypothetical protein n=1 Tax=Archangium violaceum TaxID=83451 RepID=UPI00193C2CB3|nr:hypothetical protein [Archangium violaceum]QRK09874.1 hypothetical protein JQX13_07135 [Archangium violaceum]